MTSVIESAMEIVFEHIPAELIQKYKPMYKKMRLAFCLIAQKGSTLEKILFSKGEINLLT